jgi:RimJ/RimL family protein N-acetyltransferase
MPAAGPPGSGEAGPPGPAGRAAAPGGGAPQPGSTLVTARLELVPLTAADAGEMVGVLSAPALYTFTSGSPPAPGELRARYARLELGHSPSGTQEWRNWIVRQRASGAAVGTVQATISGAGRLAEIAWVIGQQWQGRGYATEAARALVGWLDARGVGVITAHIHPGHHASAAVAERAGLRPTAEFAAGERVWRRPGPPLR